MLYKEACENQLVLSINAYNSAIKTAIYIKEGIEHKWLHIQVNNLKYMYYFCFLILLSIKIINN